MRRPVAAFTLLEIMATLLLMVIGIAAVAGLAGVGARWQERAMAGYTAQATALTVVCDPWPERRDLPGAYADWTVTSMTGLLPAGNLDFTRVIEGRINGWYVRRTERSPAITVLRPATASSFADSRLVFVQVDVFAGGQSRLVASANGQWVWRQ